MPVTGFSFTKILANKKGVISDDMKVNPNLNLKNLERIDNNNDGESSLKLYFEFNVSYDPNIALISVGGYINYADKDEVIEAVIKKYDDAKKLDDKVLNPIMSVIQLNGHIKVLELTRQIAVPPHIGIPIMQFKKEVSLEPIEEDKKDKEETKTESS